MDHGLGLGRETEFDDDWISSRIAPTRTRIRRTMFKFFDGRWTGPLTRTRIRRRLDSDGSQTRRRAASGPVTVNRIQCRLDFDGGYTGPPIWTRIRWLLFFDSDARLGHPNSKKTGFVWIIASGLRLGRPGRTGVFKGSIVWRRKQVLEVQ